MSDHSDSHQDNNRSNDLIVSRAAPSEVVPLSEFGAPLGAVAPPSHSSPTSILSMLLRRKRLIIGVAVLVAAIGIPLVWLLYTPSYRATAVLRISPVSAMIVYRVPENQIPQYLTFVNTEVSVIRSPAVLNRVLDRPEVRDTQWYRNESQQTLGISGGLLEKLQMALDVDPRRNTELIDISVSTSKPSDSRLLADAVINEYRIVKEDMDKASGVQVKETLTAEQSLLQNEIDGLIHMRFNKAAELGTDAPEQLRSALTQRKSELESRISEKEREQELKRWEVDLLERAASRPASGPSDGVELRFASDGEWRRFNFELMTAKHRLELVRQSVGEHHPRLREASSEVEFAKKMMQTREAQLQGAVNTGGSTQPAEASPSVGVAQLKMAEQRLGREIELLIKDRTKQEGEVKRAGDVAVEIANYDEKIRWKRDIYDAVRTRRDQLTMEEKAPARVRVVALAAEPSKPSNDKRLFLTAAVLMGGLGAGLGIGYLRSALDKRIYDPKEVQHIYEAPFLGILPKLPATQIPSELGGGFPLQNVPESMLNPRLVLMENMRMIRTTLLERVAQTGERVMLITSSLPSTGKTSVAVLLAQSLAVVGKRVLLVEADLRRPVLAARLGVESKLGLAALLVGQAKEHEVVIRADKARFDLVTAGDLPESFDPEMMANGVFSDCIRRWREKYDFVLLDSPPILRVADAQILAGGADGTIMVLRSSHDRRTDAVQAFSQLSAAGGNLLGTVLIGGEFGSGSGKNGYGYGYGYGGYGGYGYGEGDRFVKHHHRLAAKNGEPTITTVDEPEAS